VLAMVATFQKNPNAGHRAWCELHDQNLNMVLNMNDILLCVGGFQGGKYPYACPEDCP